MTSRQHQDWLNRGKPDSGLALPLQLLANVLAADGYTVYVYPNDAHLDAEPPEDHTYYSETGWPGKSPKWWRHAIDIMPTKGGADLYKLGQKIVADRNRGLATWIKYVNVPTDATLKHAVQHRWEPSHASGSSSDAGHIHISCITGCETLDSAYDPASSVVVVGTTPTPIPSTGDDEVPAFLAQRNSDGALFICDGKGISAVPVTVGSLADTVTLINEGLVAPIVGIGNGPGLSAFKGDARVGSYFPRTGFTEAAFGQIQIQTPAQPAGPAIDPATLQVAVEAALKAVGVSVSPAQVAAALEDPAVKAVLVQAAEDGANKAEDE